MQDLTLVGLTEDKSKLVLVSDSGEEYTLPADAKLRAALRGDHERLGQLEIRMESALRPRDIQARIRSGESPETVAQAAQTTIDRIIGYATPVLAERAHIADRAQGASLRRKGGEGPARILGDAVAEQLRSKNVDPESVDWDSWRRDDGRWAVVASLRTAERSRRAEFIFDVQGRYVVAEDEDARWLVGEQAARKPQQARTPGGGNARRLSAVGAEQELPLGDDAIELVTPAEDTEQAGPEEPTVDLTQTAREMRGGTPPRGEELGATGDADWIATQASARPHSPPREVPPDAGEPADRQESAVDPSDGQEDGQEDAEPAAEQEPVDSPEPAPRKAGRKRRASVPSWDEIMFGGGRSE